MLVGIHSFGSLWMRRANRADASGSRGIAFFNTTGVLIGNTMRHRSCLYGHVRLNGCWGFRPENADKMLNRVFETDELANWNGHRKLFLRAPAADPVNPARYLVAITSEMVGWMDRRGAWRSGANRSHLVQRGERSAGGTAAVSRVRVGAWCGGNVLPVAGWWQSRAIQAAMRFATTVKYAPR